MATFNEADHPRDHGKFDHKHLSVPGVSLSSAQPTTPLRHALDTYLKAEAIAAAEIKLERQKWNAKFADNERHIPDSIPELDQARDFENLGRLGQEYLVNELRPELVKYLADDYEIEAGNVKFDLASLNELDLLTFGKTVNRIEKVGTAGLPGEVTFKVADDGLAEFEVLHDGITSKIHFGKWTSFDVDTESLDMDQYHWMSRAELNSFSNETMVSPQSIKKNFEQHREAAVLSDEFAKSRFVNHEALFGHVDEHLENTIELKLDGCDEFAVDTKSGVDHTNPVMFMDGTQIHPAMAAGYLDAFAAETGFTSRQEFMGELDSVFTKSRARLAAHS